VPGEEHETYMKQAVAIPGLVFIRVLLCIYVDTLRIGARPHCFFFFFSCVLLVSTRTHGSCMRMPALLDGTRAENVHTFVWVRCAISGVAVHESRCRDSQISQCGMDDLELYTEPLLRGHFLHTLSGPRPPHSSPSPSQNYLCMRILGRFT